MNTIKRQNLSAVKLIEITRAQVNQRVDNFLLKILKDIPRTRIYRIIRKGEVRVNKKRIKPEYKLKLGDLLRVPPLRMEDRKNNEIIVSDQLLGRLEAAILFENKHIIVIDKPTGLAVHSGSGIDFGVIDILRKLRTESEMELVHRLDRDTSGCLILAKHRQSLLAMQTALQNNSLVKYYQAVVKGRWPEHLNEIKHRLKKLQMSNGERRMYVDSDGQKAVTRIVRIQACDICSQLGIQLISGRTHQIRVHCQAEGHELVGDTKYGDRNFNREMKKKGMNRLMLHANRLELPASEYTDEIVINAPTPMEFELG